MTLNIHISDVWTYLQVFFIFFVARVGWLAANWLFELIPRSKK